MAFEIDFLPVGEGEKGGDAICLRVGNFYNNPLDQTVMVIDGGTQASGESLVNHIRQVYGTNTVKYVVSTHPDADHSSGLSVVLENMNVENLLMHKPWEHADVIKQLFENNFSAFGLKKKIEKAIENAKTLETIALRKRIPTYEPFTGTTSTDGILHVLGPTQDYYRTLIPNFRQTPEAAEGANIFTRIGTAVEEALTNIAERLDFETLTDDPQGTSCENNSSVIMLLNLDGYRILLTGDAGHPALVQAIGYAKNNNIDLTNLTLLHVPHHGSKRNVGPTILNQIRSHFSIISAPPEGAPKHPSQKVVNALIRRGSKVYITKGLQFCYPMPPRENWVAATPLEFIENFKE